MEGFCIRHHWSREEIWLIDNIMTRKAYKLLIWGIIAIALLFGESVAEQMDRSLNKIRASNLDSLYIPPHKNSDVIWEDGEPVISHIEIKPEELRDGLKSRQSSLLNAIKSVSDRICKEFEEDKMSVEQLYELSDIYNWVDVDMSKYHEGVARFLTFLNLKGMEYRVWLPTVNGFELGPLCVEYRPAGETSELITIALGSNYNEGAVEAEWILNKIGKGFTKAYMVETVGMD